MDIRSSETITVLGLGTWGFGLAGVLASKGHAVQVWDRNVEGAAETVRTGLHPMLPGATLPPGIAHLPALESSAIGPGTLLLLVVPSQATRSVMTHLRDLGIGQRDEGVVIASKGLELGTNLTLPEVAEDVWGVGARHRIALLSGPSHAEEVVKGMPTTLVAACDDHAFAERVQRAFMTPTLRIYTQTDVRGVALGSSLKNIYAIAAGAVVGLGFGDNTLAALMTRGIAELARLGMKLGARPRTFAGLTGLGDLIVTCTSAHSRNRRFGELRARGLSTSDALKQVGMVVEGVATCDAAVDLARRHGVSMPIIEEVHALIHENKSPARAIADLMSREPKPEDTLPT
jgi:glycerol-3-phosphate dehydrogenase (NAD(P)+)